jgi:hypothetical protein
MSRNGSFAFRHLAKSQSQFGVLISIFLQKSLQFPDFLRTLEKTVLHVWSESATATVGFLVNLDFFLEPVYSLALLVRPW